MKICPLLKHYERFQDSNTDHKTRRRCLPGVRPWHQLRAHSPAPAPGPGPGGQPSSGSGPGKLRETWTLAATPVVEPKPRVAKCHAGVSGSGHVPASTPSMEELSEPRGGAAILQRTWRDREIN